MKKPLYLLAVIGVLAGCHTSTTRPLGAPLEHRAVASACAAPTPTGNCTLPRDMGAECSTDADCTAGRCDSVHGDSCACFPADCSSDADCSPNELCGCEASAGQGRVTNRCLPTNCHVDSDCGANQYCAPSLDPECGTFLGVTRYACTTVNDECRVDSDCKGDGFSPPFCAFSDELGRWSCSYTACAG